MDQFTFHGYEKNISPVNTRFWAGGDTDGRDFLLLQRLGKINVTVSFSAAAVPEPGGFLLPLMALIFGVGIRQIR